MRRWLHRLNIAWHCLGIPLLAGWALGGLILWLLGEQ